MRNHYPAPGRIIDVGGYRLHLWCKGEGGPTVIVDAGCGNCSLDWIDVQEEVAKLTRI